MKTEKEIKMKMNALCLEMAELDIRKNKLGLIDTKEKSIQCMACLVEIEKANREKKMLEWVLNGE